MTQELYKKYRPKTLDEVIGQDNAVSMLKSFIAKKKVPHAILLTGGSGCGKTTIGRILKDQLQCGDTDFMEINAANNRGIDMIRDIQSTVGLCPFSGKTRVWLVDEVHSLTSDAQNSALKLLEDPPKHAYFMLATTNPNKLLKTILTRCTKIEVTPLSSKHMRIVIDRVLKGEKVKITDDVMDKLIEASEGSARQALVTLEQVLQLESEDDQIDAIRKTESKRQAIEIARGLINGTSWRDMATILKEVTEEPESLRYMILGYARSILLKGGKLEAKARDLIRAFEFNFFDSKHAGLAVACWDFLNKK